jgi:hypothetical protein
VLGSVGFQEDQPAGLKSKWEKKEEGDGGD